MGIFNSFNKINKLKNKQKASFSYSEIVGLIINLSDAKKNLSNEQFEKVYRLYKDIKKSTTKYDVDLNGYYLLCSDIIAEFDKIAPYTLYSGASTFETSLLLEAINNIKKENDNTTNIIDSLTPNNNHSNIEDIINSLTQNDFKNNDEVEENKTELTIALNNLGRSNDIVKYNRVLDTINGYCMGNECVYVFRSNDSYLSIKDYGNEYFVVFTNKYQALLFSNNTSSLVEISFTNLIVQLLLNYKSISGINLDRSTTGLIIETPKILNKIFGTRDVYQTNIKDWGEGIPEYNNNQLMNNEMILDFGIQAVGQYLIKEKYTILHLANKLDSIINVICLKDNKIVFIIVESAIAPIMPNLTEGKKQEALELAFHYGADLFYAPVSFGSTDGERFNQSIALQGDSYYAKFVELEKVVSQFS